MSEHHGRSDAGRRRRDSEVSRVLWIVLSLNLVVAVSKIIIGSLSGLVSLLADGFHSLLDAASNVLGLIGLKAARKAPDADHPYGHRKFEALAALGISAFLFLTSYEVITEVLSRFRGERQIEIGIPPFVVVFASILISSLVSRYERRQGERLRSLILVADSRHTQSDVFTSVGVLGSLVAALLNYPIVDLVVAIGIALYIAYSGYLIVDSAFSVLADAQVVDPEEVVRLAREVPGVTDAHRVRSRGLPDDIHVDLHLHVPPEMTIAKAHDLAHAASERIKKEIDGVTDVVVHIEPEDEHVH